MRHQRGYLVALTELHRLGDADERRAAWRQGMAALATAALEREPAPLEGFAPDALLAGVRAAMRERLLDDLGFLSRAGAAVALYELGTALPASGEKRELGRRVLVSLHDGDAATFTALATSVAQSSRRPLSALAVRARVALVLSTPAGVVPGADELALALASRRDLEREWLTATSTGALPSRRLAARLIERAARQAARRLDEGDEVGLGVFAGPAMRDAWERLIADRESLVWRHVAAARGLLAHANYGFAREIDDDLAPDAGPTRWRRAATSLAASMPRDPERVLARCRELAAGESMRKDPGVARALLQGLIVVADVEPEATSTLAAELVAPGGVEAIEALVELRREREGAAPEAAAAAASWLREALAREAAGGGDDGRLALLQALREELLDGPAGGEGAVGAALRQARDAVLVGDSAAALAAGRAALAAAGDALDWLEQHDDGDSADRRHAFRLLRELELGLLDSGALGQVLALGGAGDDDRAATAAGGLPALFDRLERWLLSGERVFDPAGATPPGQSVAHFTYRLARWRALVRVLDAEAGGDEASTRRERRMRVATALLERARGERPPLRRAVWAALTRSWDALLRDELAELSDVLAVLATRVPSDEDFGVLCEATMQPDVARLLMAYREAMGVAVKAADRPDDDVRRKNALAALGRLARALPPATSTRVEALRTAILRMARALERLSDARALAEMHGDAFDRLELAVDGLAQLTIGARRRTGVIIESLPRGGAAVRAVRVATERALRGEPADLADHAFAAVEVLHAELPPVVALVSAAVLARLINLPLEAPPLHPDDSLAIKLSRPQEPVLPAWLPPSRVLGGYYVLRPLGFGAGGSVFVACRADARHTERPELYALKVPDFDGGAARQLSEEEFAQLFREEARALLAIPEHENLAGFVTFDAGARPKPILVMELVPGATLEQFLELGTLDVPTALAICDGVAAGLEAMHQARVAHLDLKPANIILRGHDLRSGEPQGRPTPVLVDFGLAGRKLRPGCGSPHYGAPEVWSARLAEAAAGRPFPADVYAFVCLAYELLTGEVLVGGDNVMAIVSAQVSGQGWKDPLVRLGKKKGLAPLAELLRSGLAREAEKRPPMSRLRAGLAALAGELAQRPWPL
jgi:hypothetical protein